MTITTQIVGAVVASVGVAFSAVGYMDTRHADRSLHVQVEELGREINLERLYREEAALQERLWAYQRLYGQTYRNADLEVQQDIERMQYRLEQIRKRIEETQGDLS